MIPLSVPNLSGNEWLYIKDCLDTNWVSSVGSYVTRFEEVVAAYTGAAYAVAVSNGTAALHVSLQLAGVERNDLVLVPDITFIASVNAIKYTGANPILVDVDPDTWQMDLDLLENFLQKETTVETGKCIHRNSSRTIRAIMPVHVLGNMGDMDRLLTLCQEYSIAMVEDATEALGSTYRTKHAGTFGQLGCLSFNGNKIITTGGGGMILTNDEAIARHAKHLTTQAKADAFEYYHDETGYNYRLVNILAAMGVAQMEQLPGIIERKKQIANVYNQAFLPTGFIFPQSSTEGVEANHWLYTVKVPQQAELLTFLREKRIEARPFWIPMHQLPMMRHDLFVTQSHRSDEVYGQCISLPCSSNITAEQQDLVIQNILSFYGK